MNRRDFMLFSALASGISVVNPAWAQFDFGRLLGAGITLLQAETLSDEALKAYFDQMSDSMDAKNKVASPGDPYGKRLTALTRGLDRYAGMKLNFKAYLTPEINAFAMANGTIRVYSGLMDRFTDDEIRYVIGHEIGHVNAGHTKARIKTALRTAAAKDAVASVGGQTAVLADSVLGDLFQQVVASRYSKEHERQADDYAMAFMKANRYAPQACVTALEKLDKLSGSSGGISWLSTHPSPKERAERMRAQV